LDTGERKIKINTWNKAWWRWKVLVGFKCFSEEGAVLYMSIIIIRDLFKEMGKLGVSGVAIIFLKKQEKYSITPLPLLLGNVTVRCPFEAFKCFNF